MIFNCKNFFYFSKIRNFINFLKNQKLIKNFIRLLINIFFFFFLGYFFSNFINSNFFISFKINQFFFKNYLVFLCLFFVFFILGNLYLSKNKKNIFIFYFLFLLSFINGFNFFLENKNISLKKTNIFENSLKSKENIYFLGFIVNNPIYISDKTSFEFSPYFITSSVNEINRTKNFFFRLKNNYPKFIVIDENRIFKNNARYKDCYVLKGNIRKIGTEETDFLYKIGIKNDIYFSIEKIDYFQKIQTFMSPLDFSVKTFKKKYKTFFNKTFKNNFRMNYSLIDWLIFGEKNNLSFLLKTKKIIFNPLFLIIESKFFIWFILFIPMFLMNKIKIRYNLIIFFLSIFVLTIFNFFQSFSELTNNIILFSTTFCFFYSIIKIKKQDSFKISFIILNFLNIFLLKNYFLYSNRWFNYFCLMSGMCIFYLEIIDNFLKNFLKNWNFLGYTFSIMFMPIIFLINWNNIYVLHIKFLKILFILFLFLIIIISYILSYYYPIINMKFNKIPSPFRYILIIWLINNFFVFFPMSILYGENFSLSLVILLLPLFYFLIFIFFFYILVYINFLFLYFINFEKIKIFMIIFARIFYKYLNSIVYRLPENDIPRVNIFLFFLLFFIFIIFFYFYNEIAHSKHLSKNIKHMFYKIKKFFYNFDIKMIFLIAFSILFLTYIVASYIKKHDAFKCYFFKNNYASYVYFKTYDNQKILFFNIKNLDFVPINLMFDEFYSDFYFLKYLNINKIDSLIVNNFLENYYIFPFLKEFYKNEYIKNEKNPSFNIKNNLNFNIYLKASDNEILNIKKLNVEGMFIDENKTAKILKLNSFFDDLKNFNTEINLINDENNFFILNENFEKHFLSINLIYDKNNIIFDIKNDIDRIIISSDENFNFVEKQNIYMKQKILLDDKDKIILNSTRFEPEIKHKTYMNCYYMNILSFGNKIQIKYMEKNNV